MIDRMKEDAKQTTLNLLAVGDIMLGDLGACFGFGVGSMIEKHGPLFPFELSADILKSGDVLIGNLEVVLSPFDRRTTPFDSAQLRGQPEAVEGLASCGFDLLSLANNHIMQHGRIALQQTLKVLKEHSIKATGIELPEEDVGNFQLIEKNGFRLGFLAYNFRPQQYFVDDPCDIPGDEKQIESDIKLYRDQVDFMIVSVHWGDEFVNRPSADQVRLGRKIIDCGASVVLGHHPHILQGVEKYNGGVIAYSLGNFVFDMWQERLRQTMILRLKLSCENDIEFDIIPMKINRRWQPEAVDDKLVDGFIERVQQLSKMITDDASKNAEYEFENKRCLQRYRRDVYKHYLMSIHRMGLRNFVRNCIRIVRNRLE